MGTYGVGGELIEFTNMKGPKLPKAALFPRQEILDDISVERDAEH